MMMSETLLQTNQSELYAISLRHQKKQQWQRTAAPEMAMELAPAVVVAKVQTAAVDGMVCSLWLIYFYSVSWETD